MTLAPIPLSIQLVTKAWGWERIICNNDEFCGKELFIRKGQQFSVHQHVAKREVFHLRSGKVDLMTVDPRNADHNHLTMNPDDVIEIPRLLLHQITALEDSLIEEFSTSHSDEDSLRSEKGDSQRAVQSQS